MYNNLSNNNLSNNTTDTTINTSSINTSINNPIDSSIDRYFVNNKEISEAEADEIRKNNKKIWEHFLNTGDFEPLYDIQFIFKGDLFANI